MGARRLSTANASDRRSHLARALASEVEKYLVVSTRKKLAVICYCKCWLLKLAANAGRGQKLAILADLFDGLTPVRTSSRGVPSLHAKLYLGFLGKCRPWTEVGRSCRFFCRTNS